MRPVTAAALVALVLAGLLGAGDWYSRWRDDARLEYVCKPGTLLALIATAVLLDPGYGGTHHDTVRGWFVAALVLSLVGDVLLMLPREQFVGGLAAFLLAHVCYIGGFVVRGLDAPDVALALVGTAVVLAPVAIRVLRGVNTQRARAAPRRSSRISS